MKDKIIKSKWITKHILSTCYLQEIHFKNKDICRFKVNGWTKIYHAKLLCNSVVLYKSTKGFSASSYLLFHSLAMWNVFVHLVFVLVNLIEMSTGQSLVFFKKFPRPSTVGSIFNVNKNISVQQNVSSIHSLITQPSSPKLK